MVTVRSESGVRLILLALTHSKSHHQPGSNFCGDRNARHSCLGSLCPTSTSSLAQTRPFTKGRRRHPQLQRDSEQDIEFTGHKTGPPRSTCLAYRTY